MNMARSLLIPRWLAGVLGLAVARGLLPGPGVAQPGAESRPKPTGDMQVIALRHVNAVDTVNVLSAMLDVGAPGSAIRLVADDRTSSILVAAPPAELA